MALLITGLTVRGYRYNTPLYCVVSEPANTKTGRDLYMTIYASAEARKTDVFLDIWSYPLNDENRYRFTCEAFKEPDNEPHTASYKYLTEMIFPDAVSV